MERLGLEISWASLWRILIMILSVALFYYLRDVVITILLSIFISTALNGIVSKIESFKIPRLVSTIIVFAISISVLSVVIYTIVPIAIIELNSLLNGLDGTLGDIVGQETANDIRRVINPDLNYLANILLAGSASFFDIAGRLLGGVAYFFTVLVLSFYLTVSRDGVANFLRAIFPSALEERALRIYERISRKVTRWFHAQLVLSLVVGFVVFMGLLFLGVKYSLTLAIFAGIFELIPIVGPIFAGAVAIVIAMTDSATLGFYVFLLFLVVQQVENNVLVPLMLRRAIDIHPVVVLVALLGGAQLAGFAGMLLSIPVALIGQEFLDEWMAKKKENGVS